MGALVQTRYDSSDRHGVALRISSSLTRTFQRMYRPGQVMIPPEEIIAILNRAGLKFVVMGAHGVAGSHSEPRSTQDVDLLVQKRHHGRAVRAIRGAFPAWKVRDQLGVTRFVDPATKMVVVDLMKPAEPIYQAVFRNSVRAGRTYRVPDLEMALACKFAAMVSPQRLAKKKHIDAGDFMDIVDQNRDIIDLAKLRRFAEKVRKGGGKRIAQFVEDAKAGRMLKL